MKLLEGLKVRVDETERDKYDALYAAMRRGDTIHALVTGVEKDDVLGECLVVGLDGPARGLIPESEVGQHPWRRLSDLVGQEIICRITSIDRQKGVAVLSRKAAQEVVADETWALLKRHEQELKRLRSEVEAARKRVQEARKSSKEELVAAVDAARAIERQWRQAGPELFGVVRRVGVRAALVDIGGVLAVLGASEVHHAPVTDCREHLRPGDGIKVRVLWVDSESKRVYVSRRAVIGDPWQDVERRYKEGGIYLATVVRVRQDDVIVELEPGVVAHVDKFVLGPAEGSKVLVLVRRIRSGGRWIGARLIRVVEEALGEAAQAARG